MACWPFKHKPGVVNMDGSKERPSVAAMAHNDSAHQVSPKVITGIRYDLNKLLSIQEKQNQLMHRIIELLPQINRRAL